MADKETLKGKKVAVLAAEMFEQVELTEPWKVLEEAGAELELVSLEEGEIHGFNHYDRAGSFKVDKTVEQADVDDYDALLVPGGVGNPDQLRMSKQAMDFVRGFWETGKPMGVICHAPWVLVETRIADGLHLTSWPSIKTDVRNAGGNWVDEEVVVDQGLTTSRGPDDLPAFCAKLVEEFAEGRHERPAVRVRAHATAS